MVTNKYYERVIKYSFVDVLCLTIFMVEEGTYIISMCIDIKNIKKY